MAVFGVAGDNRNDEITQYQMGRYISSNEAVWRIMSFPMHERHPVVVHLAVHLKNSQRIYFNEANVLERAAHPPATTLTAFFKLCETDKFAINLLYSDMPQFYTWNVSSKKFQRRKQGTVVDGHPGIFQTDAIGRIYTVHPNNAECFYLRLLLVNVNGPKSFQELRTVNGLLCQTYREACQLLHLLEDDAHWDSTLQDASTSAHPQQIRMLFAIILSTCSPSNPLELWNKYKHYMAEDILIRMRHHARNPDLLITLEMYNEALIIIEDMCLTIVNKALVQLGMTAPNREIHDLFDRELQREQEFNSNDLRLFVQSNITKLNIQQKHVYDTIMQAVSNNAGGLYFLDAPGAQQSLACLRTNFGDETPCKTTNWFAEFKRVNLSDKFHDGRPFNTVNNKNLDVVRRIIETDKHTWRLHLTWKKRYSKILNSTQFLVLQVGRVREGEFSRRMKKAGLGMSNRSELANDEHHQTQHQPNIHGTRAINFKHKATVRGIVASADCFLLFPNSDYSARRAGKFSQSPCMCLFWLRGLHIKPLRHPSADWEATNDYSNQRDGNVRDIQFNVPSELQSASLSDLT
ncbi:hypothetical protein EVAR_53260_1 [Eumeta japonica]|uniref:Uncharacterized protein n=1 Tax=Eumeta variegata TaxID=151549 RepID=A0A4C1YH99_EUMVA|nr:hypothetical protein EVAR_53260_1 [Eumeta japonica]